MTDGLVLGTGGANWKADGTTVARLAKMRLKRLPRDPGKLGNLLHGLGEIEARCHTRFLPLLEPPLRMLHRRLDLEKTFDQAARCDHAIPRRVQLETLAFAQWVSRAELNWGTFQDAIFQLTHLRDEWAGGRFGLCFAARVILTVEPSAIASWIARHRDRIEVAAAGRGVITLLAPWGTGVRAVPLLSCRNTALECLAAASLVVSGYPGALSFADCRDRLVRGGIDSGNVTWMMGHRLKEAIHQRYRLENAREQTDARLRQLELDPDMAHGGRRHASHEIESLHTRREQGAKAYAKNLTELEQMLSDLARDWPQTGLTQHQMTALENVFVNTPEFRYRLAEKIGHQENYAWLLRRNIENMKDWLGAGDGMPEALGKYFIPNDQQFVAMAPWAAKSLIALYADDKRGIGKRTSDIAFGISQAVVNLCTQPFAAARQPVAWQSAIPRSAYTTLFALTVVAGALHAYRDRVMVLNSLAIEHAFLLLRLDNPGPHASLILDKLASAAVIHMKYLPSPDDARREWAAAVAMPAFPRALALWSSANLIDGDATLACSLFRRAGELPLSRCARDRQLSRMLSLLDLAVATGTECKRPDLVGRVIDLWDEIYPKWRPLSDRWNDAARMLVAAVAGDGQERAAFVSDPAFARSHCRQMIDGVGNALPPP